MAVILVKGGAGYVGSHACKALAYAGQTPVTFDNLSTGWRAAVQSGHLIEADLLDAGALSRAFINHRPDPSCLWSGSGKTSNVLGWSLEGASLDSINPDPWGWHQIGTYAGREG